MPGSLTSRLDGGVTPPSHERTIAARLLRFAGKVSVLLALLALYGWAGREWQPLTERLNSDGTWLVAYLGALVGLPVLLLKDWLTTLEG